MVKYLRAEELGMTSSSAILSTGDGRFLKVQTREHLKDLQSIYDNSPNSFNQFISSIQEMGKRRIARQYIVKNECPIKFIRDFIGPLTSIELDDNTRIENALTPCAFPQTVIYGGEVMIDEDVLFSEEDFKSSRKELDAASQYLSEEIKKPVETSEDLQNFIQAATSKLLANKLSRDLSDELSDFRNIRDNTRFKKIAGLKYNHNGESAEIDDRDYSELKVSGFGAKGVINAFSLEPSYFAVLGGNVKDGIYKVKVNGERALKNISGIIGHSDAIEGVLDFMKQANLRGCTDFIPLLLEKSGVSIEDVHTVAEVEEAQTLDLGGRKIRTFDLTPKKSFVTLNNGSERKTVAAPTYLGVNFGLSMSDLLNVKIEGPVEIPVN